MKDLVNISQLIDLKDYEVDSFLRCNTISLNELENKTIVILSIDQYKNNKYNKAGIKVRLLVDNVEKILMTTSFIIVKQLLAIKTKCLVNNEELPKIQCKVIKEKGYFKLT